MKKIKAQEYYIASIYFLIVGVLATVVSFVASIFVVMMYVGEGFGSKNLDSIILSNDFGIIFIISNVLLIALFSVALMKFINHRYDINDKNKMSFIATAYLALIFISELISSIAISSIEDHGWDIDSFIRNMIHVSVVISIYYYFSTKYEKQDKFAEESEIKKVNPIMNFIISVLFPFFILASFMAMGAITVGESIKATSEKDPEIRNILVQNGVTQESENKSTEVNLNEEVVLQNSNVYKNEQFGFEFSFYDGYKDLWKVVDEKLNGRDGLLYTANFFVNEFPLFTIYVRDIIWWEKNAVVDQDNGSTWLQDELGPVTFGIYLGQNEKYVFTLLHNNQSCPDLMMDEKILCDLVKDDEDMVKNSFKITIEDSEYDFDVMFFDFNEFYKKALFATGKSADNSLQLVDDSLAEWEKIEDIFVNDQPKEYEQTQNWSSDIREIGDLLRESQKFVSNGEFAKSHENLEQVRKNLKKIREENNVVFLTDLMLTFHDTMEEVVEDGSQKDLEKIVRLKKELEPIAMWEDLVEEQIYISSVKELEVIVNNLEDLSGDDYIQELNKIKSTFIDLYLKFG